MIAIDIVNLKDFMQQLLKGSLFDIFEVRSVEIQTFTTFQLSGLLHKEFFSLDEQDLLERDYANWKEIQPFVFQIVKGSRLPKKLKVVFSLPKNKWNEFLSESQMSQASVFFLNLLYEDQKLTCTTGVGLTSFTLDKTIEHLWDDYVQSFFQQDQRMEP